ncbi:hypothetical protein, partial [Pseudomonas sp. 2822-17]|uniref:hypothetical protein n=1 Tax=Pseudomonas sp. 2822-17 TaxID=1712678 RepID=UPI00117B2B05
MDDSSPLSFTPYINGVPISPEELTAIFSDIEIETSGGSIDYELEQDGSAILVHIVPPRFPFLLSAGEREVAVTVHGSYADEMVSAS